MTAEYQNPQGGQPPTKMSVCGIIGLVLGVLAIVLSFIPIINNAAAVLGCVGAILGIIAIVGTFRGKKSGKAIAIVGTVLSVLAVVITLSMQASFSKAIDEATGSSSSSASSSNGAKSGQAKQDKEGDLDDMHVNIVSAVKSANDFQGEPTVLVTYEWKNTTDKNNSFMVLADAKAFQNGQELQTATYSMDTEPEGYEDGSAYADVQPGAMGKATIGYVLKDDSPVTIDVTDLFSLKDDKMVEHTFNL
ncbi:hypothetical protein PG2093B_0080 [Bifidobacterium pseudolongum subsp. globosum]|uniref:DUF5067 domain-containing protein n=1 Tax=Bifidobacterium pseudolongum subsp. globosum TaxID=1690 RepID=A0A4Q5A3M4_9BIFI|nr:DUF5067 domain-containing protein [Bifidobacterium pseudolongum]RYQ12504.1 hypothetical protein PG2093B_0080 [Bifidobacterium pseudolongum subsp. globosum]